MISDQQDIADSELQSLQSTIEASLPAFKSDLKNLVNIDCGTYIKAGVDEVGAWVADRLRSLGAEVSVRPHETLGDTVIGVLHGQGALDVLMVGHMDTVFDAGTVAARSYNERDGRAYGPGVDDMKGGLLSGLYALAALQANGGLPFRTVTFVANPDEEIGSPSSLPVIREYAETADLAIVLESARENGDIVSARKGIAEFVMTITGRSAHAGVEPEKGRSAILEASHKIQALHALNGLWPGVTVNVGVMHGGMRPNIVAETAVLEIDVRAVRREDMQAVEAAINEIAASATVADVTANVRGTAWWWPMEKTPATAKLAEMAIGIAARLGFELSDTSTGGASDANTASAAGAPTLDGLGPVGGNAHAPTEYMELDSIVPRTTLLAALLLEVSRRPSLREQA